MHARVDQQVVGRYAGLPHVEPFTKGDTKRQNSMDMLYYIYIGSNRVTIDHLSKITGGMFMAVSSCNKAAKVIDGIRERYNTSILYEESTPQKDSQNITFLHKRFPRVYIILITEGLQQGNTASSICRQVSTTPFPPWPAKRASSK